MLKATQLILDASDPFSVIPLIKIVNRYGEQEDILRLFHQFLLNRNPALLEPIMLHGNVEISDELFKKAIWNGKLRPDFPVETLYALSSLRHAETEHLLFDYYAQLFENNIDWELHKAVCLSLLNYSCKGHEHTIKRETEKCLTVHLFPEFIPVLAYKTGCLELGRRLYEHGSTQASSDSSAGLILGIALFGSNFNELFRSIIWNPAWEAGSSSTGNRHYTLMGLNHQGITLQELFYELKTMLAADKNEMAASVMDFISLLEARLHAPNVYPAREIKRLNEPVADIYNTLFKVSEFLGETSLIGAIQAYAERTGQNLDYALDYATEIEREYEAGAALEHELACYVAERI